MADNPNTNHELRVASATEWLRAAITQGLAAGVPRKQMHLMVATAPPPQVRAASPDNDWSDEPLQILYDEVPDGLLTLADAAAKYQVRYNTLAVALFRGNLPRAGRIRGRGQGGIQHLISEVALRSYLGLDPEIPEAAEDQSEEQGDEQEAEPHPADDDLIIHDELPEGCVTLTEGARRYSIPVRRMRNLVRRRRLTKMGYLRGKGLRGGSLLLLEAEVAALDEEDQSEEQGDEQEAQPHPAADDLVLHDELPEDCITLTEGARRYGIPVRRMRNLVSRRRLTKMGYLRGKGPQGGALLLLEAEVAALDEAVVPGDSC